MTRQTDPGRLQQINDYIEQHPGVRAAGIAEKLELSRSTVTRALPALEEAGYLLSEDWHGRLWPFNTKRGRWI